MLSRLLVAVLAAGAVAAESDTPSSESPNKAIYFHPFITLITANADAFPVIIPITFEKELDGGKSIVVQPTLEVGSIKGDELDYGGHEPDIEVFGLSALTSYRFYLNGTESHGIYLAPAIGLMYVQVKQEDLEATGKGLKVLGYLGARGKWDGATVYADIGVGQNFVSVSGDNVDVSGTGLALDLNLGIGFPF